MFDELVKSQEFPFGVIPAKAGIQSFHKVLDSGFRRSDELSDFLRVYQYSIINLQSIWGNQWTK
jgi:hypothetical protein